MRYCSYDSPLGEIILAADDSGLTNLWIEGQRGMPGFDRANLDADEFALRGDSASDQAYADQAIACAREWLDEYFSGREPDVDVPLHMIGTEFQCAVWRILLTVEYGTTTTYGDIAALIAKGRGIAVMSSQAVGGAVSRNKILLIIPCHRVMGVHGNLTGYDGGIEKKIALLKLEGAWQDSFFLPRNAASGSDNRR